jgi:hypothetical protein
MPSSLVVVNPTVKTKPCMPNTTNDLETATTATSLATGGIGWGWSNILNSANLHAGTSESTESGLSTWARGFGAIT